MENAESQEAAFSTLYGDVFPTEGGASVITHCSNNAVEYTQTRANEVAAGLANAQSKFSILTAVRSAAAAPDKNVLQAYIKFQRSLFTAIKSIIIYARDCDPTGTYSDALKLDIMKAY